LKPFCGLTVMVARAGGSLRIVKLLAMPEREKVRGSVHG